jgi:hypothetical protein
MVLNIHLKAMFRYMNYESNFFHGGKGAAA